MQESVDYQYPVDNRFSRFSAILPCDEHRTDRWAELLPHMHYSVFQLISRSKFKAI